MAKQLFANNVSVTINEELTATDTTITVSSAASFPTISGGDWIMATIVPQGGQGSREVVKITAISGNNLTVVRGQEGTAGQSFLFGSVLELRVTKGSLEELRDFTQTGTGATARTKTDKLKEWVSVKDFGAVGDGVVDDTTAITTAITAAQLTLRNLYFPPGIYKITSTIALSGNPIALIGEDNAPMQQGSTRPSITLRWTGGASPMFTLASSAWSFIGMAPENFGTATDFIEATNSQYLYMKRMSFMIGSGASIFSRSIVRSSGNNLGYSIFETIHCFGAAPAFIDIDGLASPNGITPIVIGGRSVFESNSASTLKVVKIKDENLDQLIIRDCTFNQQSAVNELTIVDTTDSPLASRVIDVLDFHDNEWDTAASAAGHRMMRLNNVPGIRMSGNTLQGGGSATALVELVNSHVTSFEGNQFERVIGPVFNCDATSAVVSGKNAPNVTNSRGITNDNATASGIVQLTYGTTVLIQGEKAAPQDTVFQVVVTNAAAWTLSYNHPTSGYFTRGQIITLNIKNTSGGAGGAISTIAAIKTASGLTAPANGNNRSYRFFWDGTNLIEITASDVPN